MMVQVLSKSVCVLEIMRRFGEDNENDVLPNCDSFSIVQHYFLFIDLSQISLLDYADDFGR
jgi:hypothetical protein